MGAVTIEHLLDHITFDSTSEAEKGARFERLIQAYLATASDYQGRFGAVWLWNEWPGRQGSDEGIDLVAEDLVNGGLCAVQCKFYDPAHTLQKSDIDSFFTASGKEGFTSRLIVSTSQRWSSKAEAALQSQQVTTQRIGLADLLQSNIDWSRYDPARPAELTLENRKRLHPHQVEAVDQVFAGFAGHPRGKLIMACGTGKTFTSLRIAERVATENKAARTAVLFLVPSIALLNQSLREWKREAEIPFRAFAVCSDTKVGKRRDDEDIATHDLAHPATTDAGRLVQQWQHVSENDAFTVVFSTYQSADVVARAAADLGLTFDLVVCDEAHRTTGVTLAGDDESAFVKVHGDAFLPAARRLYMTATPRIYGPDAKKKAEEGAVTIADMGDEALFGPEFHRLGFGEAVKRDLLSDYKVVVLTVDERYIARNLQSALSADGELNLDDAARIVGCWNGLAKRFDDGAGPGAGAGGRDEGGAGASPVPMRRAVAFAANINASKKLARTFGTVASDHVESLTRITEDDTDDDVARLRVEVDHVDGTMNALVRGDKLAWLQEGPAGQNECRVLSNARCLSEGVDVPALDAVMFLSARKSQVDVVQSVGRVMRKAEGKDYGYIILPVVVPAGSDPVTALNTSKNFDVVWEVLRALRAHDERFQATINHLELNKNKPGQLITAHVGGDDDGGRGASSSRGGDGQTVIDLTQLGDWQNALYAKIVQKVGQRRYWDTWAGDIARIAGHHIERIRGILADPASNAASEFDAFLAGLRGNLNEGITAEQAVEMLAQHLITKPVFEALFDSDEFTTHNPVARTMEGMLAVLDEHRLASETETLERFYESVRDRVRGIDNAAGRQRVIVELYDKFFAKAFKKTVDKLGIVYTPVEIVDFILHSADWALREHFGRGLTDEGVHVLDGFTGTGTFLTRLLQSGLISPHDLARKYATELHANEILLLAYYIAAVNIETVYQEAAAEQLGDAGYRPFEGLVLADTFQMYEDGDQDDLGVFVENNERVVRQRSLPITVVVGNPPYSSGQDSANDDNANEKYEHLDAAIRDTYAARSTATNKNSLYDSYIRAVKWASIRIRDRGVVAFVTNGGWLDSNTADGMRTSLAEEFSAIHVFNLRGNGRIAGEAGSREGRPVFEFGGWRADGSEIRNSTGGSRATIAIFLLVKDPAASGPATVHYTEVADYLTARQKLDQVSEAVSFAGLEAATITPNEHGDWLKQRSDDFGSFLPLGNKDAGRALFSVFSAGLQSNRDAWVYNFSHEELADDVTRHIDQYNAEVRRWRAEGQRGDDRLTQGWVNTDPTRLSWSRSLRGSLRRGTQGVFRPEAIVPSVYRPYTKHRLYFDRLLNHERSQLPHLFPTAAHPNVGFYALNPGAEKPFSVLMVDQVPDLALYGSNAGQFFARWHYEKADVGDGTLFAAHDEDAVVVDGYRRIDNITDAGLAHFRDAYGESITKDDGFFYTYGLLHAPDYRQAYAADLKKMLPRIPLVDDPWPFIDAGRRLSDLHVGYEQVQPYPLGGLDGQPGPGVDPYDFYRVQKMTFARPTPEQKAAGEKKDRSAVVVNPHLTLTGIPEEVHRYLLGARTAVEWILERYQVKTDKASGIVNDPNDWSREVGDPRYIVDLLARVVTVSVETVRIVESLPPLAVLAAGTVANEPAGIA
ncbi:damage-inducible protein [Tersicoccus phoenicis]|uniref:Damage-inducible protein n=1 Tax=Tersicoccus phoenicis TaxID=554083 RepID=A0A1R1LB81_9MICC|nr:type ISP restriction/modification enzyme [Tersicoccus phoenicis]OMH24801.1 damage-inducible protein [Tersicoccus phoenicis]